MTAPPERTGAIRTALVTGASGGIGRATAARLAERGDRVLLVARDRARGEDAARLVRIRAEATGRGGTAEVLIADLERQADVRRLAADVSGRVERLDVLVNNAGAILPARRLTPDGIEATLALDHVAYFLLTTLLLDPLRAAAAANGEARVVVVSSDAHKVIRALPLDDLQLARDWSPMRAYGVSKLANVMFAYALARRLQKTDVTVNALHPGVVASGFGAGSGGLFESLLRFARPFFKNPEQGARTSVYLATDPAVRGATGGYYKAGRGNTVRATRSSAASYDVAAQDALWTATEAMVAGSAAAATAAAR